MKGISVLIVRFVVFMKCSVIPDARRLGLPGFRKISSGHSANHFESQPIVLGLCFMLSLTSLGYAADNGTWLNSMPFPEYFLGTWRVSRVLPPPVSNRTLYQWNDPRLIGRFLILSQDEIRSDLPENELCLKPRVLLRQMTFKKLILSAVFDIVEEDGDIPVDINDYRLFKPTQPLDVAWLSCGAGDFGPDIKKLTAEKSVLQGASTWLVHLDKNKFILGWYNKMILEFERNDPEVKIKPSFKCSTAGSDTEKAICNSASLSSFDLSLAKAYKLFQKHCENDSGCIKKQGEQQLAWIKKRDRCGSNSQCIADTMAERLEVLMVKALSPD